MALRKGYKVKGLLLSNVKEFCNYIFGRFYISASINRTEDIIEVLVKNKINIKKEGETLTKEVSINEYVDIEYFNKCWKGKIKVLSHKEL